MHGIRGVVAAMVLTLSAGAVATQVRAAGGEAGPRELIAHTARALAAFDDALGLHQEAALPTRVAGCAADAGCDLASALDQLRLAADTLRDQTGQLRSDDTRLGSGFTAPAAAALMPAVQALPEWSSAAPSSPALTQKWTLAQRAMLTALQAAAAYLKFSGADTAAIDAALARAAAGR